jgi:hypothetical protein
VKVPLAKPVGGIQNRWDDTRYDHVAYAVQGHFVHHKQASENYGVFVDSNVDFGANAPVMHEDAVFEKAEYGVCIADIYRQEHRTPLCSTKAEPSTLFTGSVFTAGPPFRSFEKTIFHAKTRKTALTKRLDAMDILSAQVFLDA